MARIHIEHVFDNITVDEFWKMLLSPEFDAALKPAMGVKERVEMERQDDDKVLRRRIRMVPGFELPAAVKKLFAGKELEYVETSTFHKDRKVMEWSATPGMFADKVKVAGRVVVVPQGNGVRRTIEGDITVDIFGVGGLMEKGVVESVRGSYEKAAALTRDWIRASKHKPAAHA